MPRNALLSDEQGSYVFQIQHGKARRVGVKVVAPDGSPIGVEGDIDPHAPFIGAGSLTLKGNTGEFLDRGDRVSTRADHEAEVVTDNVDLSSGVINSACLNVPSQSEGVNKTAQECLG